MALNGAEFLDFVKNQMFINPNVFDERVLQIRSSKTPAFIAIQFGGGLADNVSNLVKNDTELPTNGGDLTALICSALEFDEHGYPTSSPAEIELDDDHDHASATSLT